MDKAEQLQLLLELTAEYINEFAAMNDITNINSIDIFQEAVSQALVQYQFVTTPTIKHSPIGKVDTKTVAFQLQDKETTAILQGSARFLVDTEFDTLGGDPDDDEN